MPRGVGGHSPSNIAKHLQGIDYPAGREELIGRARQNNAPREVLDVLQQLPDRQYTNMADLMKGVGEVE
jgi:hypothetical protein